MTATNTDKRPISWVKLIATLIAIAGVGFVLFLKNKRPNESVKKELIQKHEVK